MARLRSRPPLDSRVQALSHLNGHLPQPLPIDRALTQSQKALTTLLDQANWDSQLAASAPSAKALLWSEVGPGASGFLTAVPHGRRRMEPAAFNAEVRHRLGIPDSSEDTWCPQCDAVLDCRSFHAGVCAAGGERTQLFETFWPRAVLGLACNLRKSAGSSSCPSARTTVACSGGGRLKLLALPAGLSFCIGPGHHWLSAERDPPPGQPSKW